MFYFNLYLMMFTFFGFLIATKMEKKVQAQQNKYIRFYLWLVFLIS